MESDSTAGDGQGRGRGRGAGSGVAGAPLVATQGPPARIPLPGRTEAPDAAVLAPASAIHQEKRAGLSELGAEGEEGGKRLGRANDPAQHPLCHPRQAS